MCREDVIEAIRRDPSILQDHLLRDALRAAILDLIPARQMPRGAERHHSAEKPITITDGWMSYADAARLPGVTYNAVLVWVSRGNVNGGEGFVEARDLLRWLSRDSSANKQHASAQALRAILQDQHA